ncbi:MAG: hypothetical protein AAFZ18_03530 [Myxococcota bacterium]
MRVPYVLTGGLFSVTVWSTLIDRWGQFAPVEGVAYAFWGALSLLAVIGIRFPVRMLPLLLLQLAYKAIWIAAVGYPLLSRGELDPDGRALLQANLVGVVIDAVAIPWRFTVRAYLAGGARPLTRRIPPDPEPQSTAPAPS